MKLIWHDVPAEIRDTLAPLIDAYIHLVPQWCERLNVRYDAAEPAVASVDAEPEYRHATLYIHGLFLGEPHAERANAVVHEIVHIAIEPMRQVFLSTLDNLLEDYSATQTFAREEWRRAMEAAVCDITNAITRAA